MSTSQSPVPVSGRVRRGAREQSRLLEGTRKRARRKKDKTQATFPLPRRLVAIGDLNGDDEALAAMLRSLNLIDNRGRWIASDTHLVQMGDVVNRGTQSRAALERLRRLQSEAGAKQSRVTVLLGNHEAMTALGNEAWVAPEEYIEFATQNERAQFEVARARMMHRLLAANTKRGRTGPITGKLRAWEEANAPGREAFAAAFSSQGDLGRYIRSLPVAVRVGPVLFVHGGLRPRFAALGIKGLNESVRAEWREDPKTQLDLDPSGPILAEDGPLWDRSYAIGDEEDVGGHLSTSLAAVRASMMVVGHTRTDHIPGGINGVPMVRHGGRLGCVDVGIGGTGGSSAALFIEKGVVWCWRAEDKKRRLCALAKADA